MPPRQPALWARLSGRRRCHWRDLIAEVPRLLRSDRACWPLFYNLRGDKSPPKTKLL